jgi:glutamate transport system permease protein
MLPALISQLVVILKDTSLAAVLALYTELRPQGDLIALNLHNPTQILPVVAVIFILINYSLSQLATWLDERSVRKTQPNRIEIVPAEAGRR